MPRQQQRDYDNGFFQGSTNTTLARISSQQDVLLAMTREILNGQKRMHETLEKPQKPSVGPIEAMVVRALTWILPVLALGGVLKWEDVAQILQALK